MNTTGISFPVTSPSFDFIDQEAESPDIFQRDGIFYVAASNTCGYCNGSIGLVYRSRSLKGPWTRDIIAGDSCEGQVEGVLPLTDPYSGKITFVWHSTSVPGGPRVGFSGHIFQPLGFNGDGSVRHLDCSTGAKFTTPYSGGSSHQSADGLAIKATDQSPRFAAVSRCL